VRGRAGRRGELAFGLRRRRPNPPEAVAMFAAYEGAYHQEGPDLAVYRKGDQLFARGGNLVLEMIFDSRDRFRVLEFDLVGHGELGPDGKVAALVTQSFGDQVRRATRIK
jgi:hypothetical protein